MRCERFRLIECVMSHVTGETVRGEARGGQSSVSRGTQCMGFSKAVEQQGGQRSGDGQQGGQTATRTGRDGKAKRGTGQRGGTAKQNGDSRNGDGTQGSWTAKQNGQGRDGEGRSRGTGLRGHSYCDVNAG
jgi:hypothetical protein